MATRYCEACGQPVLRTDVACWHCGAALAQVPAAPEAPSDPRPSRPISKPPRAPYAPVYTVLTAVIALALLLVTVTLGRRPLLLQGVTGGAGDWVALSGAGGRYRVHIPASWTWLQAEDDAPSQAALTERVAAGENLRSALSPLADRLDGSKLLLLAEGEDAFFLLSRSPNLAGLDLTQLAAALRQETFATSTIREIGILANDADQQGALLDVDLREPALRCRQLVLPGKRTGYLAAACTTDQSGAQDGLFLTLLSSLQIRE